MPTTGRRRLLRPETWESCPSPDRSQNLPPRQSTAQRRN
jgi:hypothetical protein